MNLKDKKVLITGATGGIGNSLVKTFNNLGSTIVATGTNEEKLSNLLKEFPNLKTKKFVLENHEKIEEFVNDVEKEMNGMMFL